MSGQIQVIKQKTLSDKMHLMAESLRNCTQKKCIGKFYDPRNDSLCAYGALGFMSGIPKDELKNDFSRVLGNYDIDLDESMTTVDYPNKEKEKFKYYPERRISLFQAIYLINDRGHSFVEVANYIDKWADNL